MRFPWRGRAKRPDADPPAPPAPPASPRAWDQVAPLRASVSARPPLTARAVEHAADIGVRLRSTSVLVHAPRAATAPRVPDVGGTMAGIATASAATTTYPAASPDRPRDASLSPAQLPDMTPRAVPVRPAPDPARMLLHLDPDTASTIAPMRRVSPIPARQNNTYEPFAAAPQIEPAGSPAVRAQPRPEPLGRPMSPLPIPVPGHTVVRRRPLPGEPRRVGLQAPLEPPPTPARMDTPAPASAPAAVEQVPERVVSAMQQLHRADLREVPVVRGEAASRLAKAVHAKALTVSGEVFLPRERGSLDSPENRGLVAHELTHVLQQRRLGTDVPMEHTPAGRALEAQAAATERIVRGDPGSTAAPADEPRPPIQKAGADLDAVRAVQDELTASGFATRAADGSLVFAAAAASSFQTGAPVQRAPDTPGAAPAPAGAPADVTATEQPVAGTSPTFSPWSAAPATFLVHEQGPAASGPTPGPSPSGITTPGVQTVAQEEQPASPAVSAPVPDIDEMARKLYDRVAARLRSELTLDRERAGLLTDLR